MKKYLLLFITFLTSLIFISNIKALGEYITNMDTLNVNWDFVDLSSMSDEKIKTLFTSYGVPDARINRFISKLNEIKEDNYNYYIALDINNITKYNMIIYMQYDDNITFSNDNNLLAHISIHSATGSSIYDTSYSSIRNGYHFLGIPLNDEAYFERYYSVDDDDTVNGKFYNDTPSDLYDNSNFYNISFSFISEPSSINDVEVKHRITFYYSNKEVKFVYDNEPLKSYSDMIEFFWYNINFNGTIISSGDIVNEERKPEINIETIEKKYTDETEQEQISEKIKINFSIFDKNKYLYFYSTSKDRIKTWIDILENDFEYTSYSNGTLYIAVIDKEKYVESAENSQELVFDYIATATYTFSNLTEDIPDLEFSTDIPDSCYLTINGIQEIVCKRLTVKAKNYNDLNRYRFEYSNDKTNFLTLYSNDYVNVYSENTTVVFRLYDVAKDEYIKMSTYNLDGISKNMALVGPYVNLKGKYNKERYFYEISAYFYNYDSSLYNYYYSIDRENWSVINSSSITVYSGSGASAIYLKKFEIYQNCTFYLKIEDKNGNYISSYTFTVDIKTDSNPQGLLEVFKNNGKFNVNIFSSLNNVYDLIRKSKIGAYIFIIICGSIIILLLKSMR